MAARAVLFDLFDTLVDLSMEKLPMMEMGGRSIASTYGALHREIVQRVDLDFEAFERELSQVDQGVRTRTIEEGREYPTLERFQDLLARLGVDDEELAERLTQTHMGLLRSTASFVPEHVGVLRELRGRARIAICSNFSHARTAISLLEESGLLPHIDEVVISEEVGIRKPRPEIFAAALERLGATPQETLHVGDRLDADVLGAKNVGIEPVWITRRVRDPQRKLQKHGMSAPKHTIVELRELLELV